MTSKRKESSFSEEKEAKRLLRLAGISARQAGDIT
jgi:hypothetical protein